MRFRKGLGIAFYPANVGQFESFSTETAVSQIRTLIFACLLMAFAAPASAQYFRSTALRLPFAGYTVSDSWLPWNDGNPFLLSDQGGGGVGFMVALWDYKLWYVIETGVSFGRTRQFQNTGYVDLPGVTIGINGSTGLRFNFAEQRWRPFVQVLAEVKQDFQQGIQLPFLLGPRGGFGLEWICFDEMSFQLDLSYAALFNFVTAPALRHAAQAKLSFNLYL